MTMNSLTKSVRHLEAAFGKLVAAARKGGYFSGDSGLSEDADVVEALSVRALWMKVEEAEKAEDGYRIHAEMAARNRGLVTARLEVEQGEEPGTMRFGLIIPMAKKLQEDRIMMGLQMAVQNIAGSMVIEQEMVKLSIMRLLEYLGKLIVVAVDGGNAAKLRGVARALAETDGQSIASILATLNTIAAMDEIIEEEDADQADG